ncbi:hypothetical protein [Bacteroides bouchesdurhonensis]|uniref:hypothetical protein n=1 Tax=Bacteroides bouchesdurhonensis TaxID=1841855 RepID=UPI00101AD661|nr:hypothetical protein [Bacteroides bouchesdurhonensis]
MKKSMYRWVMAVVLVIISVGINFSCEDYDELPQQTNTSVTSAYYRAPDPVVLNVDEAEKVNEIKKEYNASVSQEN